MPPIGLGRIFWAVYPGGRGDRKKRPMIVVSRRQDLLRTGEVVAIVCSTDFHEPLADDEVLIPSVPSGTIGTRLKQRTVAVCNWRVTMLMKDIEPNDVSGMVPTPVLKMIFEKAGIPYVPER